MSVANILGADGKIKALYFPGGEYPESGLTNPLTANLDCSGFEVAGASYVRTDVVECETLEPKLLGGFIECVADLQMGVGNEIRSELVVADEVRIREGANYAGITYTDGFNELKLRPRDNVGGGSVSIQQGGGARPQLNFYDVSAGFFGNVFLDAATTLRTDSEFRIARGNPVLSLDNAAGKVARVRYSTSGNTVELRPPSDPSIASVNIITSGGAPPSMNLINEATGVQTNLTSGGGSLQCNRDFQIAKATPTIIFTDVSGTPVGGNFTLQRTSPTDAVFQSTRNLNISSATGELGLQRLNILPAAGGNLNISGGLTVTNTAPTLPNDAFISVVIAGTTYELALKRA